MPEECASGIAGISFLILPSQARAVRKGIALKIGRQFVAKIKATSGARARARHWYRIASYDCYRDTVANRSKIARREWRVREKKHQQPDVKAQRGGLFPEASGRNVALTRRKTKKEAQKSETLCSRTCEQIHVLQAGGVLLLEAREGCLELQLGDLACHVPHY